MLKIRRRALTFGLPLVSAVAFMPLSGVANAAPMGRSEGAVSVESNVARPGERLTPEGNIPLRTSDLPGYGPGVAPTEILGDDLQSPMAGAVRVDGGEQSFGYCNPDTKAPYPHKSTWKEDGVESNEASAHGYWYKGSCPADANANVTVRLYEYYANPQGSHYWSLKKEKSDTTYPREHKSSKDVVARVGCHLNIATSWRSEVDVDVNGYADPPTIASSQNDKVACRTW